MQILYKNSKLEKLLTDEKELKKKYGEQVSKQIIKRMDELKAFESLGLMPSSARVHPYEPKHEGKFLVDINKHNHPIRMIIKATGEFDLTNLSSIKAVEIIEICKTHS